MAPTRRTAGRRGKTKAAGAAPGPRIVYSLSEAETEELGRSLGAGFGGGELVLLVGDLGLGKTVLARGIALGLGLPAGDVNSPSFTLIQEYNGGRLPMVHVDLYRLDGPEDVATLGLDEILASGAVVVVEWGEKLPAYLRRGGLRVRFRDVGEGSRRIDVGDDPADRPAKRRGDA